MPGYRMLTIARIKSTWKCEVWVVMRLQNKQGPFFDIQVTSFRFQPPTIEAHTLLHDRVFCFYHAISA
jgi:hypothetical protein